MSARSALILCFLTAANLAAMLEIALSSGETIRALAAGWVALSLTLAGLVPFGAMVGAGRSKGDTDAGRRTP
jgi:hypothetical protein